jgi:hypothetical protein
MALTTIFLNFSQAWLKNENTDANLKRAYLISKVFQINIHLLSICDVLYSLTDVSLYIHNNLISVPVN